MKDFLVLTAFNKLGHDYLQLEAMLERIENNDDYYQFQSLVSSATFSENESVKHRSARFWKRYLHNVRTPGEHIKEMINIIEDKICSVLSG